MTKIFGEEIKHASIRSPPINFPACEVQCKINQNSTDDEKFLVLVCVNLA
jgi:hypothetical protein